MGWRRHTFTRIEMNIDQPNGTPKIFASIYNNESHAHRSLHHDLLQHPLFRPASPGGEVPAPDSQVNRSNSSCVSSGKRSTTRTLERKRRSTMYSCSPYRSSRIAGAAMMAAGSTTAARRTPPPLDRADAVIAKERATSLSAVHDGPYVRWRRFIAPSPRYRGTGGPS